MQRSSQGNAGGDCALKKICFCFFPSSSWRLPGGTDIIHNPGHWLPDPWPQMEANLSKSWGGWCSHLQWYSDEVICSDTQVSIHHHGPWSRGIQGLGESLASDAPEATREWLCCSSSWCGEHQVCLTREHQRPPQATSEWRCPTSTTVWVMCIGPYGIFTELVS